MVIFSSPHKYSTGVGSTPYMITVGDFNNDHQLDIAVANFDTNSIGIHLGYGNGTFENKITVSTGTSRPIWINVADVNNDTVLDLFAANYGTDSISLIYGCEDGTFSSPIIYSTGYDSLPSVVVAGDLNNDNHSDLIVANYGTDNVGVFLSCCKGTLEQQIILSTGVQSRPHSVVLGHFNDDNKLDIAVANSGTNNIGVFLGYGDGTFTNQTTYSTGTNVPLFIGTADFNNDHRLDLFITKSRS